MLPALLKVFCHKKNDSNNKITSIDQKINHIVTYMNKLKIMSLEVKNFKFLSKIKINKINFSKDIFECFEENTNQFNELNFDGTPYHLQQQFFALANALPISEEEFNQNIGYEIIHFNFYFYADKETRRSGIYSYPLDFIACAPYYNQPYQLFTTQKPYVSNFFEAILYAKSLCEHDERFGLLKQAIEIIDDFINRDGEYEIIDQDACFDELLILLESPKYIDTKSLLQAKQHYHQFNIAPKNLFTELIGKEISYEYSYKEDFDNFAKRFFLKVYFHSYHDDWKIDYEALSEFISISTGQPFNITFEEALEEFELIKAKLEDETDYTLLNVNLDGDETLFLICRKEVQYRVLELARILAFPIES